MSSQAENLGLSLAGKPVDVVELPVNSRGINARYHSELAMRAAKRMRSTRHKRKTGQQVCHHLRMMLASEPVPRRASNDAEPQFQLGF